MTENVYPDLSKIAVNWTEEEYHKHYDYLCYSQLSKYSREGFDGYLHLNENEESDALRFGSMVDCLLTDKENFEKRFYTRKSTLSGDKITAIAKDIANYYKLRVKIRELSDDALDRFARNAHYYDNKPKDFKVQKIREQSDDIDSYIEDIFESNSKTIVSVNERDEAARAVCCILYSDFGFLFNFNSPNIKSYKQLKFKEQFNGIPYRCMADLIVVDHDKKLIMPYDLKTSSESPWNFSKSFLKYRYDIQARLYWRIINSCVRHSKEFYDYKVDEYRFIVYSKVINEVILWNFPETKKEGEIVYGKNKQIVLKDPFDIGKELWDLIKSNALLPKNIERNKCNNISNLLKNL